MNRLIATIRRLYAELLKFGVVGSFGVLSDFITSNYLWHSHRLSDTMASVVGTAVATVVGYIGNRYWTFRHRPADRRRRAMALFAVVSAIGLVIENSFVFITDHVLDMHGTMAKNIAKFGFGLVAAGIFRFWASHAIVFPEADDRTADPVAVAGDAEAPVTAPRTGELPVENGAGAGNL